MQVNSCESCGRGQSSSFHMGVQWTVVVYCKDHALPTDLENSPHYKPSDCICEALFWVLFCPTVPFLSLLVCGFLFPRSGIGIEPTLWKSGFSQWTARDSPASLSVSLHPTVKQQQGEPACLNSRVCNTAPASVNVCSFPVCIGCETK